MERLSLLLTSTVLFSPLVLASGALDSSFGENGTLIVHVDTLSPSGSEKVLDDFIDSEGRYVSFGSTDYEPEGDYDVPQPFISSRGLMTRHLPTGQLDASFADQGVMRFEPPTDDSLYFVWKKGLQLPDGKLLAAGDRGYWFEPPSSLVCRFNADGSKDLTFAASGCRKMDFSGERAIGQITDLEAMPDGRIVVMGYASKGTQGFALARLDAQGQDDSCFGDSTCQSGGFLSGTDTFGNVSAQSMSVTESGAIVIAGTRSYQDAVNDPFNDYDEETGVAFRIKADGTPDKDFGEEGTGHVDYNTLFPNKLITLGIADVLGDGNGGLLIVGALSIETWPPQDLITVMKLDASGHVAMEFANNGSAYYRFTATAKESWPAAASLDSNGRLLIAGHIADNYKNLPAVLRLRPGGKPDTQFGAIGAVTIPNLPDQFWMYPSAIDSVDDSILVFGNSAMQVQDGNPALVRLVSGDKVFKDSFDD